MIPAQNSLKCWDEGELPGMGGKWLPIVPIDTPEKSDQNCQLIDLITRVTLQNGLFQVDVYIYTSCGSACWSVSCMLIIIIIVVSNSLFCLYLLL